MVASAEEAVKIKIPPLLPRDL